MRADSFGHPDQSCERVGSHLSHNVPAVHLNGVLGDTEFSRSLFVHQAADQQQRDGSNMRELDELHIPGTRALEGDLQDKTTSEGLSAG
jgi:hypothetical protein